MHVIIIHGIIHSIVYFLLVVALQGYRVLTLAIKEYACSEGTAVEQEILQQLRDRKRVEEGLAFAGVLVLTCPIKKRTQESIYVIRAAGHRVVMITGDNPLTACQVAREVGIFSTPVTQHRAALGCNAEAQVSLRNPQLLFTDTSSNAQEKHVHQQQHSDGFAGDLELSQLPAHASSNQSSSASRHVLIFNAKETYVVAGVGGAPIAGRGDVAHIALDATAGSDCRAKTPYAAANDKPAGENDTGRGKYERTGKKTRETDTIDAAPPGSTPAADHQTDGKTAYVSARFEAQQTSAAAAAALDATYKHNHDPRAAAIRSLPVESIRHLFYWESPEGRIVAKASSCETVSDEIKGNRLDVSGRSSVVVSKASELSAGASSSSGGTISSVAAPALPIKDSGVVSSSSAASVSRGSSYFPSCSSSENVSLISCSPGKAPALGMPRWLAPVFSVEALAQLAASYELCVTGAALDRLFAAAGATTPQHQVRLLQNLVPFVAVYARMSPQQKELVLVSMNSCGHVTLMCGDGTNDVGALKAAHVGVSLLCHKSAEKEDNQHHRYDNLTGGDLKKPGNESGIRGVSGNRRSDRTSVLRSTAAAANGPTRGSLVKGQSYPAGSFNAVCRPMSERQTSTRAQRWQSYLEEALEQAEAADDPPLVRLGDASVASPFTHKGDSIEGVKTILRAGRATLVTVIMMYKLMALNSVVTAFSLSVLTLDGVKLGDLQTTLENLLCTVLTLLISKAQPSVENMSTFRPISSVFHPAVLLSLIGQAAIHCFTLYASWVMTRAERGIDWEPDIDGPFEPNLVNTVVFLLITSMHASTFLSNYEGAPFMKPLRENKPFCVTLGILLCSLIVLVLEIFPDFNTWLSLVPFQSSSCKFQVIQLVTLDILGSWAVGWSTRKLGCWMACNRSRLPKLLQ